MHAIQSVIKYEGDNSTFVWKHPNEDFNTNSKLIVHESQEALFFKDGQALELFGPGKYDLDAENIPVLRGAVELVTGFTSQFHCEVYFINKTEHMAISWGTDTKVQYIEPQYGFPISIGAGGEMTLSVADSRLLVTKIVGTEHLLTRNQLVDYFRSFLMIRIKTYMAQTMKACAINIFEIDERLEEFSSEIKERLVKDFLEYGVNLDRFFVTRIVKPDGDPQYERFKDLHFRQYADIAEAELQQKVGIIDQETKKKKMVIEAQGIAEKRATEGYTYQQERGFDVAEGAAKNEGTGGQIAGMGIGLGMMAGVGGAVGSSVNGAVTNAFAGLDMGAGPQTQTSAVNRFCDQCGAELTPGAAFCDNCGAPQQSNRCRNCGFEFIKPGNFCPKCGAKRN